MKTALKSEENREERREAMKSVEKIYIHEDLQSRKGKDVQWRLKKKKKKSKETRGRDDNFDEGRSLERRYIRDGPRHKDSGTWRTEAER